MGLFWGEFAGPVFGAERAVIEAGFILVAIYLAVGAERAGVEPIAIAVEAIFGEIFVPGDFVA